MTDNYICLSSDVILGKNVVLTKFLNLYGCSIGDDSKIGPFVEIQRGASIGSRCKISSHTFICDGVDIGDNCFIGHGVMFINDNSPQAVNEQGQLESPSDWKNRFVSTKVGKNVTIGSNATILGNVSIGQNSTVGAGSVVTKNIPPNEIWAGNPAKLIRKKGQ